MQEDVACQVAWSQKAQDAITEVGAKFLTVADLTEFMRVLKAIDGRLRRDAIKFGEVYRSSGGVEEHLAVQDAVAVDFAVDRKVRFVLVRACRVLSSRGG